MLNILRLVWVLINVGISCSGDFTFTRIPLEELWNSTLNQQEFNLTNSSLPLFTGQFHSIQKIQDGFLNTLSVIRTAKPKTGYVWGKQPEPTRNDACPPSTVAPTSRTEYGQMQSRSHSRSKRSLLERIVAQKSGRIRRQSTSTTTSCCSTYVLLFYYFNTYSFCFLIVVHFIFKE